MNYNWEISQIDDKTVSSVAEEFQLPNAIAKIMVQRGINSRKKSRQFFYPDASQLHDPYLMQGMKQAVARINKLIENNGTLLLFGDYDVDGTTGTAAMYLFFKKLGVDVHFYIPDREREGYGVSLNGIDFAVGIGAELMITCDCGITAVDQTEYANSKGIDVIITDHHKQDEELPNATAILNPNQNNCTYPFKGLCGAGVAFKLLSAICISRDLSQDYALKYTDLITLGIATDLVPVLDENRYIVQHGLLSMEKGANCGLNALIETSGFSGKEITVGRLVFWIAPKINAAGRLGDASRAVKLMTTNNPVKAKLTAEELEQENKRRQNVTSEIVENSIYNIHANADRDKEKATIVKGDGWHHGVIGIVASRIKEDYNKPTIIISFDEDGIGRGSCRSIPGFDIHNALGKCRHLLEGFGGHPMAAGLSLKKDNYKKFYQTFQDIATQEINEKMLTPRIKVDTSLNISEINSRMMKFLKALAPFGPGNMRPKFIGKSVKLRGLPRIIGKNNDTLKFTVTENKSLMEAIAFRMEKKYEHLISGKPIHLIFEVGENDWNGQQRIQLEVKDIKSGEIPCA